MEKKNLRYSINASAISRYANRNFDLCLRHLPISSGQQFFLLRIYENPGIPLNGLAQMGFFDKGTVSRGVQKLEERRLHHRYHRRKRQTMPEIIRHPSRCAHHRNAAECQRRMELCPHRRHDRRRMSTHQ